MLHAHDKSCCFLVRLQSTSWSSLSMPGLWLVTFWSSECSWWSSVTFVSVSSKSNRPNTSCNRNVFVTIIVCRESDGRRIIRNGIGSESAVWSSYVVVVMVVLGKGSSWNCCEFHPSKCDSLSHGWWSSVACIGIEGRRSLWFHGNVGVMDSGSWMTGRGGITGTAVVVEALVFILRQSVPSHAVLQLSTCYFCMV